MSTNPFDDENGTFYALVNEEGQHSLWPAFAAVPAGWTVVHGAGTRQSCVDYVEEHWTDLRPKSLIARMERDAGQAKRQDERQDEQGRADVDAAAAR